MTKKKTHMYQIIHDSSTKKVKAIYEDYVKASSKKKALHAHKKLYLNRRLISIKAVSRVSKDVTVYLAKELLGEKSNDPKL